jgi:protease YdgD
LGSNEGLRARIARWRLVVAAVLTAWGLTNVSALPLLAADDGRVVVDALNYPWSAIGRVNVAGRTYCTGFLVSERHVLTAGHCLYDRRRERWHSPSDLHFVAAYQFDQILMHSPVAYYRHADGRKLSNLSDIEASTQDWAVLTLHEPIGRVAGWLGMMVLDETYPERAAANRAAMVQAGYSAMRPHAITISSGCEPMMLFPNENLLVHGCEIMDGDSGSPWLVYRNGQFFAAGLHVLKLGTGDRRYAGVLSFSVFSDSGRAEAREAFGDLNLSWSNGKKPGETGPARDMARRDLDSLLLSTSSRSRAGSAGGSKIGFGFSLAQVLRLATTRQVLKSAGTK